MNHDKLRSDISVNDVDWDNPYLSSLLEKTAGWRLDSRSNLSPYKVQIHISSGWTTTNTVVKHALVVAKDERTMVLLTLFPISLGERVGVSSLRGDNAPIIWGKVLEGREGRRAEDREHGLFMSRLRLD